MRDIGELDGSSEDVDAQNAEKEKPILIDKFNFVVFLDSLAMIAVSAVTFHRTSCLFFDSMFHNRCSMLPVLSSHSSRFEEDKDDRSLWLLSSPVAHLSVKSPCDH